jgi:sodium transport system permease protein
MQQRHLAAGLLASEWLGLLGLVALYGRVSGQGLVHATGLHRPSGRAILGAVLVGSSAWAAVAIVSEWLLPVPESLLEALRKSLVSSDNGRGVVATLGLVALSPAICEEALFRGPILRGLRSRLGPVASVALTAVLFGLFHLDVYRLIPTTLIGLMLGFLAVEADSIVPAMVAHFCNNAILVMLARSGLDRQMQSLSHRALTLIVLGSLALTGLGLTLARRARMNRQL